MVDRTWPSSVAGNSRSAVLMGGIALWNLASTRPMPWSAAKGADVLPHYMTRHVVNLLAGVMQPPKEVGKADRIRVHRVGGTPTRLQVRQKLLDLGDRLALQASQFQTGSLGCAASLGNQSRQFRRS